jgi:hypothetical protein
MPPVTRLIVCPQDPAKSYLEKVTPSYFPHNMWHPPYWDSERHLSWPYSVCLEVPRDWKLTLSFDVENTVKIAGLHIWDFDVVRKKFRWFWKGWNWTWSCSAWRVRIYAKRLDMPWKIEKWSTPYVVFSMLAKYVHTVMKDKLLKQHGEVNFYYVKKWGEVKMVIPQKGWPTWSTVENQCISEMWGFGPNVQFEEVCLAGVTPGEPWAAICTDPCTNLNNVNDDW